MTDISVWNFLIDDVSYSESFGGEGFCIAYKCGDGTEDYN